MDKIMRIGGKYVNGNTETVKGILVDTDGVLQITRNNKIDQVIILNEVSHSSTTTLSFYGNNAIDLDGWTTCWIVAENHLDVDVTIRLFSQLDKTSSRYLRNIDNETIIIPIRHNPSGQIIITPEDYPVLNYLRYFSGGVYFDTAPTQGTLSLSLFRKR